ncbi:MAG TPA: hypothetical protein VJM46_04095 [Candidatus Saccharimonadales bacterium]|nr:hypothetical protein [Candidatus Saccharimonadales bacterium]
MKVVVYGVGEAPRGVRSVQTAQVETEEELYGLMHELSGGEFALVILASASERVALDAARIASPKPKVVLAKGGALQEVVSPGTYRPYAMTC